MSDQRTAYHSSRTDDFSGSKARNALNQQPSHDYHTQDVTYQDLKSEYSKVLTYVDSVRQDKAFQRSPLNSTGDRKNYSELLSPTTADKSPQKSATRLTSSVSGRYPEADKRTIELEQELSEMKKLLESNISRIATLQRENQGYQDKLKDVKQLEASNKQLAHEMKSLDNEILIITKRMKELERENYRLLEEKTVADREKNTNDNKEAHKNLLKYGNYVGYLLGTLDKDHFGRFCFEERFMSQSELSRLIDVRDKDKLLNQAFRYIADLLLNISSTTKFPHNSVIHSRREGAPYLVDLNQPSHTDENRNNVKNDQNDQYGSTKNTLARSNYSGNVGHRFDRKDQHNENQFRKTPEKAKFDATDFRVRESLDAKYSYNPGHNKQDHAPPQRRVTEGEGKLGHNRDPYIGREPEIRNLVTEFSPYSYSRSMKNLHQEYQRSSDDKREYGGQNNQQHQQYQSQNHYFSTEPDYKSSSQDRSYVNKEYSQRSVQEEPRQRVQNTQDYRTENSRAQQNNTRQREQTEPSPSRYHQSNYVPPEEPYRSHRRASANEIGVGGFEDEPAYSKPVQRQATPPRYHDAPHHRQPSPKPTIHHNQNQYGDYDQNSNPDRRQEILLTQQYEPSVSQKNGASTTPNSRTQNTQGYNNPPTPQNISSEQKRNAASQKSNVQNKNITQGRQNEMQQRNVQSANNAQELYHQDAKGTLQTNKSKDPPSKNSLNDSVISNKPKSSSQKTSTIKSPTEKPKSTSQANSSTVNKSKSPSARPPNNKTPAEPSKPQLLVPSKERQVPSPTPASQSHQSPVRSPSNSQVSQIVYGKGRPSQQISPRTGQLSGQVSKLDYVSNPSSGQIKPGQVGYIVDEEEGDNDLMIRESEIVNKIRQLKEKERELAEREREINMRAKQQGNLYGKAPSNETADAFRVLRIQTDPTPNNRNQQGKQGARGVDVEWEDLRTQLTPTESARKKPILKNNESRDGKYYSRQNLNTESDYGLIQGGSEFINIKDEITNRGPGEFRGRTHNSIQEEAPRTETPYYYKNEDSAQGNREDNNRKKLTFASDMSYEQQEVVNSQNSYTNVSEEQEGTRQQEAETSRTEAKRMGTDYPSFKVSFGRTESKYKRSPSPESKVASIHDVPRRKRMDHTTQTYDVIKGIEVEHKVRKPVETDTISTVSGGRDFSHMPYLDNVDLNRGVSNNDENSRSPDKKKRGSMND